MATQRIQRVLASAGFGSRRACEEMVERGRVGVNGHVSRKLPILVDPEKDSISVDGKMIRAEGLVYYLLNKPKGVFCTNEDPAGRTRAVDCLVGVKERVYPVGRLDADSMGLLIMTNDGALAQKLTHARYGAPKTYRVEVAGLPTEGDIAKLRSGMWLSEGKTAPAQITIVHKQRDKAILEVTLRESRNREIRRMLAKLGHNVRRLVRIRMGKLSIAKLPIGGYRRLTPAEVSYLKALGDGTAGEMDARIASRPRRPSRGPHRAAKPGGRTTAARAPASRDSSTGAARRTDAPRPRPRKGAAPKRRILGPDGPGGEVVRRRSDRGSR